MNLKRLLLWTIIGTGISSISTELLIVREFLTQFHGNEITISLVFFVWLLLTGAGSLIEKLWRRPSLTFYGALLLCLAVLPLCELVLIRYLREIFFIRGVSPGFNMIILYVTLLSAPFCLITGFVLPYSQKVINAAGYAFDSGQLYQADNIGDILGGMLFSFILVYWLSPFRIVLVSSLCLLGSLMVIFAKAGKRLWLCSAVILGLAFALVCMNRGFELQTLRSQFGNVVRYVESPYGRIVISQDGRQHTFWESGTPLYFDSDIVRAEEKIHYALSQRDTVKNVLLISGGLGETLEELAKYGPRRVDYVELDPRLTSVAFAMGVIKSMPWLHIANTDGRLFLKKVQRRYDFIIVDLPDPDTFQINRFFTREFFFLAKKKLRPDGVLSLSMEYSQNFVSKVRKRKLASLYETARAAFKHVLIVPGNEAFFLCSDTSLSPDIPALLRARDIRTKYIEGFYYGNVTQERLKEINNIARSSGAINQDFKPVLVKITLEEWFLKQGSSPIPFLVGLCIAVLAYLMLLRREEYILFTTGLSNMGTEMLVVYSVQILYGYIYLKIGAIVTAFLFGLLPGAVLGNRFKGQDHRALLYTEMALIFMLGVFLAWCAVSRAEINTWLFLAYGVVFSLICGFQFPVVARVIGEENSPAAGCLAADLAGAAVGTFFVGAVLVPVWGLVVASAALILCKAATTMVLARKMSSGQW